MREGKKVCCFFGHRKISSEEKLREKLYKTIEELIIKNNVGVFIFGSRSDFDRLCREVVNEFKEKYTYIHRVYIRAEYQHISDSYEEYLLQSCDETYYSKYAVNAGKAVYIERNFEMIDKSDICILYYSEEYLPPKRKRCKTDLTDYQPKSGTRIAFEYATRKKKCIINLY